MTLKQPIVFLSILLISFTTLAQQTILERFQADVKNSQVILTWTIKQGNTCNGIAITRSLDSLNYFEIGDIEGICGDVSEPVNYNFTDVKPFANRKNFYRLELGDVGSSKIISTWVVSLNSDGYYIIPNPSNTSTRIYFSNSTAKRIELKLFDINGRKTTELSTNQDYFDVNLISYNSGMYVFMIFSPDNTIPLSGKIIIQ